MRGAIAMLVGSLAACAALPPPARLGWDPGPGERFVVVGDLQRTSWLELWREQNDRERALVVSEIARRRPAFVVSLGDLVFDGSSARDWASLDRLLEPWRTAQIPVVPVLGNHELWGPDEAALARFRERFREVAGERWRVLRRGPLALVLVDTNFDDLDDAQIATQDVWLAKTLESLDADPALLGVLVAGHHPAWTVGSPGTELEFAL